MPDRKNLKLVTVTFRGRQIFWLIGTIAGFLFYQFSTSSGYNNPELKALLLHTIKYAEQLELRKDMTAAMQASDHEELESLSHDLNTQEFAINNIKTSVPIFRMFKSFTVAAKIDYSINYTDGERINYSKYYSCKYSPLTGWSLCLPTNKTFYYLNFI